MSRSEALFDAARRVIAGGVNSPVRAFKGVGGTPVFFRRGQGAYLFDEDGRRYIDYVGSFGPLIAGHAHPEVVEAVREAAGNGLSFGAPTAIETEMAETLCRLVPSIERVRLVSSGTEATMSAIRLARGYTGRDTLVKFEGCYHGHADSLLIKAGSGALTLGTPSSPGVPEALARHTLTLPYNDFDAVEGAFATLGNGIAAVIVEPVAGNMNCVPPLPGFLEGLRRISRSIRQPAHLRRGHDRFPGRTFGCPGALRDRPRPHHARQGDRRRTAGRRLRGSRRDHGTSVA